MRETPHKLLKFSAMKTKSNFAQTVATFKKENNLSDVQLTILLNALLNEIKTKQQDEDLDAFYFNLIPNLFNSLCEASDFTAEKLISKILIEVKKYTSRVSEKEISEQKKLIAKIEDEKRQSDYAETRKVFLKSFGELSINRTINKAVKIKESNSKTGLTQKQKVNEIGKTALDYLQTLPQRIKVSKDNKYFPFLAEKGATGVIGCLSVNDLLSIVLSSKGILLITEAKFIKACKNALMLEDTLKTQAFENGVQINRLINSIFKENADVSEVLHEVLNLTNTEYLKGKQTPKFSTSQLDKLEKVANSFYLNAYEGLLPILHKELKKEQSEVLKVA
jgi:hypothetical protein